MFVTANVQVVFSMTRYFSEKTRFKNLIRKYALKKEKGCVYGPIDYEGRSYWAIYYEVKKLFKKPVRTCIIIVDSNQKIVTDRDLFKAVSQIIFLPRPTNYFQKIYEEEIKEFSRIYTFFSQPEKYVLQSNISTSLEKAKELGFSEISETLENTIVQSEKIAEIASKILEKKEKVKDLIKIMQKRIDQELVNVFLKVVVNEEGSLMKELLEAFHERKKLLQELENTIIKRKNIESLPKDFDFLLKNIRFEIKALGEINTVFENLIKMRKDIQELYDRCSSVIEEFYEEMLKRIKTIF